MVDETIEYNDETCHWVEQGENPGDESFTN